MLGLWPEGAIVYAGVVLIANHKLFLEFNYISFHGPVLLSISALLYFGFLAFESVPAINFESTLGIFEPIFSSPLTYFALFFVVVVNYMLDRIIWYILSILEEIELEKEKVVEVQIESSYIPPKEFTKPMHLSVQRNSEEKDALFLGDHPTHTGYAFAEENNPNPKLFENVRRGTLERLSRAKMEREN